MTCTWCDQGFPLHAQFGVHDLSPLKAEPCEDMPFALPAPEIITPRSVWLRQIRKYPHAGECGEDVWEFEFTDGSIKRTVDPAEANRLRRLFRVHEGITHG